MSQKVFFKPAGIGDRVVICDVDNPRRRLYPNGAWIVGPPPSNWTLSMTSFELWFAMDFAEAEDCTIVDPEKISCFRTCDTCVHWTSKGAMGFCDSMLMAKGDSYDEAQLPPNAAHVKDGRGIRTGPKFGCVNHKEKA